MLQVRAGGTGTHALDLTRAALFSSRRRQRPFGTTYFERVSRQK